MLIDIEFDMREDSHGGDPDKASKTLKDFHQILWTKQLPSGEIFKLEPQKGKYLVFIDGERRYELSSDSIANSYSKDKRLKNLMEKIDQKVLKEFVDLNSTIGGFIVFPGNRIAGGATINGARGLNSLIADRFDLTLECIRRHYLHIASPLSSVLGRYEDYFSLFIDFKSFVDFFLLNDLVNEDYSRVLFFTNFEQIFQESPLPGDVKSYMLYKESSMAVTRKRNQRMASCANLEP